MKKTNLIALFIISLSILSSNFLLAQTDTTETESPISVNCDLMSRYVWRGTDFGGSPSIQPGIAYTNKAFTIGAWGAFTTNNPGAQEADLYVTYTIKDIFSVTITDYFFPDETSNYKYFNYGDATGHIFEATIGFNGTEKIPLSVILATNFYGADAVKNNGDIQYSTYAELSYAFKNANIFVGLNLSNADEGAGESGFYGNNIGVVNLGISSTKEIKITDSYKLPLTISLITNPQAEKIYLLAGFSF